MKHGVCPKCQSTDVLHVPGTIGAFGAGNHIPVGWRAMNAVAVARLVCGSCGYCEEWITDPRDLERVRQRYAHPAAR